MYTCLGQVGEDLGCPHEGYIRYFSFSFLTYFASRHALFVQFSKKISREDREGTIEDICLTERGYARDRGRAIMTPEIRSSFAFLT